jgi:hypothetical protein
MLPGPPPWTIQAACLVRIPPKILKPLRRELGVFDRVLNVAMAQEQLDGPRILLVVGQLIAAPVSELMGVHGESQPGEHASVGIILRTLESVSGP